MKTTAHLTTGYPADLTRRIALTRPGMAHWAASGPFGRTCAACLHYGYQQVVRDAAGNTAGAKIRKGCCAKYHELTGIHGPAIPPRTEACRHFAGQDTADQRRLRAVRRRRCRQAPRATAGGRCVCGWRDRGTRQSAHRQRAQAAQPNKVRRTTYLLTVRAEPGVDDVRALRAWLKIGLRTFGLRCLGITPRKGRLLWICDSMLRSISSPMTVRDGPDRNPHRQRVRDERYGRPVLDLETGHSSRSTTAISIL